MKTVYRFAEKTLKDLAKSYPALVITGPRQSGKTTLTKKVFDDKDYVSLEDLDTREFAQEDPRGFLDQYKAGAILDEVQRCPDLFSYLQSYIDAKKTMGRFILTGSQQFDLISGVSQSLAGRVARLSLLPFSLKELQKADNAPRTLEELLFKGLYPPIYDRALDAHIWQGNYIATYLEKDVRRLINVRDLSTFQRFLKMCAARTGQILNLSSLANDCGITHNTAKAWISVLEASYIVCLLQPHHKNFNKRLVKSPKLYFLDTGVAAWLLGIETPEQLTTHSMRGALFETWAVSEMLKERFNQGLSSNIYFWRDNVGHEIDIIVEKGDRLDAIEVKSGKTLNRDFFTGLNKFAGIAGNSLNSSYLIHGGDKKQKRHDIDAIPWDQIDKIFFNN